MKFGTFARIVDDNYFTGNLRAKYWRFSALVAEIRALFQPGREAFRGEVVRNHLRYSFLKVQPVRGETALRARAGVDWILRGQAATADDGVSLGYFPCNVADSGWKPSYPETTGYIITTLLAFSKTYGDPAVAQAAMRMARWEAAVQMRSGAVQGGPICAPDQQTAAAFNTGMVLDGLCSAYLDSKDVGLLEAARGAADFLINDLDDGHYFKTNGAFVSSGEIKTYTCLCAWAIYRFGDISDDDRYRNSAVCVIEAALNQQAPNGWFAHNCLTQSYAPLTHTIGYTLQGVLEVGILAGRADFIAAVRRTADALLPRIASDGFLHGRFYADWEPAGFSSCLTGSAQIAIVCYRLGQHLGDDRYGEAADKLVDYLKALQLTRSEDSGCTGAIAGSFPLFGAYMRAGYPNWATKYFLDALLLQQQLTRTNKA